MQDDPNTFNLGRPVGVAASVDTNKPWSPESLSINFGSEHLMKSRKIWLHVTGGDKVGDTLRVLVDRPREMGLKSSDFLVIWRRDGVDIHTGKTYTRTEQDVGRQITVAVFDAFCQVATVVPTKEQAVMV